MAINLNKTYLLLETDGEAVELPVGDDFWEQLESGNPTDPKIKRLAESDGRMLSRYDMRDDWGHWERHPAGDEILILVSGRMTILVESAANPSGASDADHARAKSGDVSRVTLRAGDTFVVPRGHWHTAEVHEPCDLIAITAGQATEHRPR